MLNKDLEKEIFQNALKAFKKNIGQFGRIEVQLIQRQPLDDIKADFELTIKGVQDNDIRFYVAIKKNVNREVMHFTQLDHWQQDIHHPTIIITPHVNPKLAEELKAANIQFIDTAGNAYINQGQFYIFVKGNKLPEHLRPIPAKRTFKPTGIKIVYAFLCNPDLVNEPYREIARIAKVALGTVGWVMRDLKQMGYLVDIGKRGKRLVERDMLYHKWEIAYQEQLRPKLIIGRYQGDPGWWRQAQLNPQIGQWGGEVAAEKLTQYLQPEIATVYLDRGYLNEFLLDNRLRKDPNGNTEIFERFWTPDFLKFNIDYVHPLLIFTDLYETNDQRNREVALKINEEYIKQYLREN